MVTDFLLGALRGCLVLAMVAITLAVAVAVIEIAAEGTNRITTLMKKSKKLDDTRGRR